MSKNLMAVLLFSGVTVVTISHKVNAQKADDRLKSLGTPECEAFSEVPRPSNSFTFRRYKQEDKGRFYLLRDKCEQSVQEK